MADLAELIARKNNRRFLLRNQIRFVPSPEGEEVEVKEEDEVSFTPEGWQEQELKDSLNPWKD